MRPNMIYKLRILVLETYVRITMIGYDSNKRDLPKDSDTLNLEVGQAGIHAVRALNAGSLSTWGRS